MHARAAARTARGAARRARVAVVLALGVLVAVAEGGEPEGDDGGATPGSDGAYRPCAAAADTVAPSLGVEAPDRLPAWPLYELELSVDPAEGTVAGRIEVTVAAPEGGIEAVGLSLPAAEVGDAPAALSAVRVAVGEGAPRTPVDIVRGPTRETVTVPLPRRARSGERIAVRAELDGRLDVRPRTDPAEAVAAFLPLPTAEPAPAGALARHGQGATLLTLQPLLALDAEDRHPSTPWGTAPPAPWACHLVSVETPATTRLVATGARVGRIPEDDGRVRHVLAAASRRVGMVLRDADATEEAARTLEAGPRVRVIAERDGRAGEIAEWAVETVQDLARRFGAYPWARLEIVEAPLHAAVDAMRGPGVVVLPPEAAGAGSGSLLRPAGDDALGRRVALARQIAHQWLGEQIDLGGSVTPAIEAVLVEQAMGAWTRQRLGSGAGRRARAGETAQYHLFRISGGGDGAAYRPASELAGLGAWLGLVRGKAAGFVAALEEAVGAEPLEAVLTERIREDPFGPVSRADLVDAVAGAADDEGAVRELTVRWLDGAHGDSDLGDPLRGLMDVALRQHGVGDRPGDAAAEEVLEVLEALLGDDDPGAP